MPDYTIKDGPYAGQQFGSETSTRSLPCFAYGFYVVDEVGRAGVLEGPFENPQLAQDELRQLNIADDCGVWERDKNGQFKPYPGYSLEA